MGIISNRSTSTAAAVDAGESDRLDPGEGGVGGFAINAFRDLKDIAGGLATLAGAVGSDVVKGVGEVATLGQADFDYSVDDIAVGLTGWDWMAGKKVESAFVNDLKNRYFDGDIPTELYRSPLSFISDALTVVTAGGAGAAAYAGKIGKTAAVGTAAAKLGAKTVFEESSLFAKGALTADDIGKAATFVNKVRGVAKPYIDPISKTVKLIDPVTNPVRRALWQNTTMKALMERGGAGSKLAEQLAEEALASGPEGLSKFARAMEVQAAVNRAVEVGKNVPTMRTWAAGRNARKFVDSIYGTSRARQKAEADDVSSQLERILKQVEKDLPEDVDSETLLKQVMGQDGSLVNDGYAPSLGRGTRQSEVMPETGPRSVVDPVRWADEAAEVAEAAPDGPPGSLRPWRDWQDQTVEGIPKQLENRQLGKALEHAMDIGREVALKGDAAKDLGYTSEKIAKLRAILDEAQREGVGTLDQASVHELLTAFERKGASGNAAIDSVQDLVKQLGEGDFDAAKATLDSLEATIQSPGLPASVAQAASRAAPDRTIAHLAEALDDPNHPMHVERGEALLPDSETLPSGSSYHVDEATGITTVFAMNAASTTAAAGRVLDGFLEVTADGHYLAATATSAQGQGIGRRLLADYWRKNGITTPERIAAEIQRQSLSNEGGALVRAAARDVLGDSRAAKAIEKAGEYPQGAAEEAASAAIRTAQADTRDVVRRLQNRMGPGVVVPAPPKSRKAILEKMALDGELPSDISRARVVDPDMFTDPAVLAKRLKDVLEETGAKRWHVENSIGRPDADGSRQLRVVVEMPDGHPMEFQFVTPRAAKALDVTSVYRRTATGLGTKLRDLADAGMAKADGTAMDPNDVIRVMKAQRKSLDIWEGVTAEMREKLGGHADSAVRKGIHDLRVLVAEKFEGPAIESGVPIDSIFDNPYLPGRMQHGAAFDGEAGKVQGGMGALELHDLTTQGGDMPPVYFPMMDARRMPGQGTLMLSGPGTPVARIAEDASLRKNTGYLLSEKLYSQDIPKVYRQRAIRMARAEEGRQMVNALLGEYSRRVTDWSQRAEDEVVWSPQLLNALYRTESMSDDAIMKALQGGVGESEDALATLKRVMVENQEVSARILKDQDVELYAIPRVVAERLHEQMRVRFGETGELFFSAPTKLWKTAVLAGSPRWVVNNLIGNTSFLKLQGGRMSDVVRQLSPRFRKRLKEAIGEQGGDVNVGGFVDTLYDDARSYSDHTIAGRVANRVQGSKKAQAASKLPRKWTEWMHKVNGAVEDAYRRASYLTAAERVALKTEVTGLGKTFWTSKKSLDRVFRTGLDERGAGVAIDEMNRFLNDYSAMTPLGRNAIRPYIAPFWGFYRHAAKMLYKMPFEHPGKARLLALIDQDADRKSAELGALPEWLQDSIPLGQADSGDWRFLSTSGANPFNTVLDTPMNMLHPAWKMLYEQGTGRDSYTGKQFSSEGVFKPFGSDQQYRMVDGVPQPIEAVRPGILQHLLMQVPQYDMVRDVVAGGSYYDTSGILDLLGGGGRIIDPETGEPLFEKNRLDTAAKYLGYGVSTFDVEAFQEKRLTEMEAVTARWEAEQKAAEKRG